MTSSTISDSTVTTKFHRKGAAAPMALLALSAGVFASLTAQAEIKDGQFELSPFVGYQLFESDHNLEDGLTYGLRLGYSITPHWAIEAAVSQVNSSVDDESLVGVAEGQFRSPMEDVDLLLYQVDALYHFRPDNRFSPYIVGGYGVTDFSPSISDKEMSTFNIGIGAKYWLKENLALRFDLRNHMVGEVFDHTFNNISLTAGVSFAFGGKEQAKPVQATTPEPARAEPVAAPRPVRNDVPAKVVTLEEVHFEFDQSQLTREAQNILKESITTLKNNPNTKVRIAGHTSAAGTDKYNQQLSEQRAMAIKNYLVKNGISENRLSVIGHGSTQPDAKENSPEKLESAAAKQNMRALFEIIVQ